MPKQDNHPGQLAQEGAEDLARRAQRVLADHIANRRHQRQTGQLGIGGGDAARTTPSKSSAPASTNTSFDTKLKRLTGKIRKASRTMKKLSRLAEELKGERRK